MCTSPLVRYRLKREPVTAVYKNFFSQEVFDRKTKGFKIIGKKKLQAQFKSHSEYLSFMNTYCDYIEIPCGKCEECKKTYARDWAVRCYHESLTSERSCFITLTVDNFANERYMHEIKTSFERNSRFKSNIHCRNCVKGSRFYRYPIDYSLNRSFIYSWLKKFRDYLYRTYGISIRYFGVGEYGSHTERPHYHFLIFGYDFPSVRNGRVVYRTFNAQKSAKGVQMKISEELQHLWKYGFSYVEDLNMSACLYVAKYCMKKIKFIDSEKLYDYYYGREPEFLMMSRGNCQANRCPYIDDIIKDRKLSSLRDISNPYCIKCNKTRGGLGFNWFWKNFNDIKKLKHILIDGKKFPVPKYYKNLINLTDNNFYDLLRNENIYYVEKRIEDDPDRQSIEQCEVRRKINKKKNAFYNSRDVQ